jgi:cyclopropane-fatty-acyl-phospholipid synthase
MLVPRRVSSRRAAEVLRRIFGHIPTPFAFRLWDGTPVALGQGPPVVTVRVHAPDTFLRLVRDPSPRNFAEAYVEGAIDLDGDLFKAMSVANAAEEIRLSLGDRVRILATLWKH